MAELDTIEGVSSLMAEARNQAVDLMRADIREVVEPETGVKALVVVGPGGSVKPLGRELFDPYRDNPLRIMGVATLLSLVSFIDMVNRFKDGDSAVFADDDRESPSILAVFDYHAPANDGDSATEDKGLADANDIARHMGHRAVFDFPLSDEWKAWLKLDKTVMSMADFAAFLEDRYVEVLTLDALTDLPDAAAKFIGAAGGIKAVATPTSLVELSRGLKVYEKSALEEAVNLSSGEGGLRFNAEHTTGDGKPLKVPAFFIIALPVFRGDQPFRMVARLRYRKTPGGVVFWYELWRADVVFDTAFKEAVTEVKEKTGLPVFLGTPQA